MTPKQVLRKSRRSCSAGALAISSTSAGRSGKMYGTSFASDNEKNTKITTHQTQRKARGAKVVAPFSIRQALANARPAGRIQGRQPIASTGTKNHMGS